MTRRTNLMVGGTALRLPCFFPSISSMKTNMRPVEYLSVLAATRSAQFLISAYDIAMATPEESPAIYEKLDSAARAGAIGLLDSGNYESYWQHDGSWSSEKLAGILGQTAIPLAFCFDRQSPAGDAKQIAVDVVNATIRDQANAPKSTILPIVHAPVDLMPEVVAQVSRELLPLMIAVPERELGDGILRRAESVFRIREALDSVKRDIPLHLLGTGNPRSILLFSACGADSFDGLEWCQTVADPPTGNLHHFQQREMLNKPAGGHQTDGMDYCLATLVHNLDFFRGWMEPLAAAVSSGSISAMLGATFSPDFVAVLKRRLPRIFE